MYWCINLLLVVLSVSLTSLHFVTAQEVEDSLGQVGDGSEQGDDSVEIEELYDELGTESLSNPLTSSKKKRGEKQGEAQFIESISDLSTLAPFRDVAVISRKFLPKSKRFELSGGGLLTLNNAFFNNAGFALRGTFYFSEKWGVEGQYYSFHSSERRVTKDLEKLRGISTRSLVVPKSFVGGAIKWAPIYGKISLFEGSIIPFDLFFNFGYGSTHTDESEGDSTFQLGVGQNFAISKSLAFRWDMAWSMYSAQIKRRGSGGDESFKVESLNHSDLYYGIGLSFFIPGAKYR